MKKKFSLLLVVVFLFSLVSFCVAQDKKQEEKQSNKGAENLDLSGGNQGKVSFPHVLHQNNLKDCNICHSVFKQMPNSITDAKSKGELKPKQVMNTLCIKCHNEKKQAAEKSGPTSCNVCHVK